MTKKNLQIIKLSVFVLVIVFLSVIIVKMPAIVKSVKNLSSTKKKQALKKSGNEFKAPYFSVSAINYKGKVLSLKRDKGKIVLINFWATWCPPCRAEIPRLEKFYKSHKKDGFTIIGLSVNNQGKNYVLHFIKTFKGGIITYPVGMATYSIEKAYGNIYEIPQSFLINRKGYIVAHITGEMPSGYLAYEFNKLNKNK
ncbi:MAG: TlpA disulfide reductase family protein [Candidatus Acidulodesulfobacterium sp.]